MPARRTRARSPWTRCSVARRLDVSLLPPHQALARWSARNTQPASRRVRPSTESTLTARPDVGPAHEALFFMRSWSEDRVRSPKAETPSASLRAVSVTSPEGKAPRPRARSQADAEAPHRSHRRSPHHGEVVSRRRSCARPRSTRPMSRRPLTQPGRSPVEQEASRSPPPTNPEWSPSRRDMLTGRRSARPSPPRSRGSGSPCIRSRREPSSSSPFRMPSQRSASAVARRLANLRAPRHDGSSVDSAVRVRHLQRAGSGQPGQTPSLTNAPRPPATSVFLDARPALCAGWHSAEPLE